MLVKPQDEILLRDRNALQKIGGLVKKIDAVIFLEGATLSHAYYQLLQTGANVEAGTTFKGDNEQQVFNKLVRDKIPQKIEYLKMRQTQRFIAPKNFVKSEIAWLWRLPHYRFNTNRESATVRNSMALGEPRINNRTFKKPT